MRPGKAWWHGGGMKTPLVREKLTLRVPADVHLQLQHAAADNDRSLNAEIVQRLRRSLERSSTAEGSEQQ